MPSSEKGLVGVAPLPGALPVFAVSQSPRFLLACHGLQRMRAFSEPSFGLP